MTLLDKFKAGLQLFVLPSHNVSLRNNSPCNPCPVVQFDTTMATIDYEPAAKATTEMTDVVKVAAAKAADKTKLKTKEMGWGSS